MSATLLQSLNEELATIAIEARASLVQVISGRRGGAGAGVIWREDGLILTNAHVVRHQSPSVRLADGREFSAEVLAQDPSVDLAALKISASGLTPIQLGNAATLRPGAWVMSVGHPWGVLGAATAGAVIYVGSPPEMSRGKGDLIQVGLTLRPGHSGGPMVDDHGRLVGINTMISGPKVGLAIPIHTIEKFLREQVPPSTASPLPIILFNRLSLTKRLTPVRQSAAVMRRFF